MHLPHYAVTTDDPKLIHVLAQQPIDMTHPHPFIEAGNREFNMFLWMPPNGERAGDILLADSTIFTTLFGGDESLERSGKILRLFKALKFPVWPGESACSFFWILIPFFVSARKIKTALKSTARL